MRLRNLMLLSGFLFVLGVADSAKYNPRVQTCSALGQAARTAQGVSSDCTAATVWAMVGSVAVLFGCILAVVTLARHVQKRATEGVGPAVHGSYRRDPGDKRDSTLRYGGPPPAEVAKVPMLRSSIRPGGVSIGEPADSAPGPITRPSGSAALKGSLRRRGSSR